MSLIAEKTPDAMASIPRFKISDAETNSLAVLKKLCTFLSENALVNTTRPPIPTRYPQFLGAEKASIRAARLDEFCAANVVLVSPGVAMLSDTVLQQGKMLVSPTPGLRGEKVFQKLIKNEKEAEEGVREPKYTRLELAKDVNIDVLVVGSMLVDKQGRRMGKKREQVGLEFVLGGLFAQKKLVIITLVHDCQVVDEVPEPFFSSMDVPVDVIVTPTKVIRVKDRLSKPNTILWNKVTEFMMKNIPILDSVRNTDKEVGKDVELATSPVKELKNDAREVVMGSKIKFQSLPRDLKYSELREVLKMKVEQGFKIAVLKFGMAMVYFKESASEVLEKLKGFDKKVEMEEMEFIIKNPIESKTSEDAVRRQKVEMKSKFKFVNVGDIKSVDLKKAFIDKNVHFGFLKIFKNSRCAIVLFQEDGTEVKKKITGIVVGKNKLEFEELVLGEKKSRSTPSPKKSKDSRSPRKANKELKLQEMNLNLKMTDLNQNVQMKKAEKRKANTEERKARKEGIKVIKKETAVKTEDDDITEDNKVKEYFLNLEEVKYENEFKIVIKKEEVDMKVENFTEIFKSENDDNPKKDMDEIVSKNKEKKSGIADEGEENVSGKGGYGDDD